jgi:hypothetical protein
VPSKRQRSRFWAVVVAAAIGGWVHLSGAHLGHAEPAAKASVSSGVDQDLSAIGRLQAGLMYTAVGNLAVEGHVGFEGFLRLDSSKGIAARSFTLLDLGVRYGIQSPKFIGPYVVGGGGFGIFTGKPHERKVTDAEVCESANIPPDEPQDECTYRIDKNLSARFGIGWGFKSGKKTTVGVRLDVTYWMFSLNDFDPDIMGAPIPREVPRPQSTWSVMIGIEFLRWR